MTIKMKKSQWVPGLKRHVGLPTRTLSEGRWELVRSAIFMSGDSKKDGHDEVVDGGLYLMAVPEVLTVGPNDSISFRRNPDLTPRLAWPIADTYSGDEINLKLRADRLEILGQDGKTRIDIWQEPTLPSQARK